MGSLTHYVADTVTLIRYLEDRLTPKVERIFRQAESGINHLFLPQIALGEFLYVAARGRIRSGQTALELRNVLQNLAASDAFTVSAMPPNAWEVFVQLRIPELHDRMIAGEAIARHVPVLSSDPAFDGIDSLKRIW